MESSTWPFLIFPYRQLLLAKSSGLVTYPSAKAKNATDFTYKLKYFKLQCKKVKFHVESQQETQICLTFCKKRGVQETSVELQNLLERVLFMQAETQTLELKATVTGCPIRLYDTLSSFSNQDEGGVLLFGVDEKRDFAELGVYDAQDLMKHVVEQCNQMSPLVRPVFTTLLQGNRFFVSAEIPGIDVARPCYYAGKGRLKAPMSVWAMQTNR